MKKLALIPAVVALLFASAASAQTYYSGSNYQGYGMTYPSYNYGTSYGTGCVILSSDLSYESRGTEVTKLQQFLVSQNYPGGGSWMITGYFGSATVQAVRNFQQATGLPMNGFVDWQTRNAIQMRTCGYGGTYPTYPSYPSYPNYPTYPTCTSYWYNCEDVQIDRLRPTSGEVGKRVTIEGEGFSRTGNTVYMDGRVAATNVSSSDGEELRFSIPRYLDGYDYGNQWGYPYNYNSGRTRVDEDSYSVTVRNAFGQLSNSKTFRVTDDDNNDDDDLTIEVTDGPDTLEEGEEGEWEVEVNVEDEDEDYTVTVTWGDGESDTETFDGDELNGETLTFEHEYDEEDDYTIRFRVSGNGDSDTDTVDVEVEND